MDRRERLIVGALWIGVAGVMATTLEPTLPTTASGLARLFAVLVGLFLAVVYVADPWGILDRHPLR